MRAAREPGIEMRGVLRRSARRDAAGREAGPLTRLQHGADVETALLFAVFRGHSSSFDTPALAGKTGRVGNAASLRHNPAMHIVHVAPEMTPYAKVGGLGEVLGSLPVAQRRDGHRVTVILPGYHRVMDSAGLWGEAWGETRYLAGGQDLSGSLYRFEHDGVDVIAIWQPRFFDRQGIYGEARGSFEDNADRFGWFSGAALNTARLLDPPPDVVVSHDWPSALVPVYLRAHPQADDPLSRTASVFVIHNLAHQGVFPRGSAGRLNLPELWLDRDGLGSGAQLNFVKGAIRAATLLVTVSPTYAKQVLTPAHGRGLDADLRARGNDLFGILNGLDTATWNPETDPHLPAHYNADDLAGKLECKVALQRDLGLRVDPALPLFGIVSRIDAQKGIDLVGRAASTLVGRSGQLVLLGTGQPSLLDELRGIARHWRQSVVLIETFDEMIAHRIYAAADFFLMPSRFEPCGLGQLVALRYGTPPIVHRTGGLADTVSDADAEPERGNGLVFDHPDADGVRWATERALTMFHEEPDRLERLRHRGMSEDLSWDRSAGEYERVLELAVLRERRRVMS